MVSLQCLLPRSRNSFSLEIKLSTLTRTIRARQRLLHVEAARYDITHINCLIEPV